jgi:serine/threonine-protein kinase
MIMAGDRVKLMDFGVARMTGSTRTEVGSMIGTVRYAAPEQVTGSTVDHRADLFSTAVMLFELLTATTPYPGRTAPEVLSRLLGPEPADLSALGATLKPLEPVLARALAKLPDRRYPGAESFASALRQSLAASGAADPDDDRTIIAPSTRRAAPPSEAIDASLLSAVERELATVVGPISKLLVRQAAGATDDSSELVATIARGIPNEADRERFLTQFRSQAPAAPAPSTRVPTPPAAVAAEVPAAALAEAERVLTFFMGPIARLMVRKESGTPCSVGELGRRLAAHIDRADQRNAFIDRYRKDVESRFPSAGTS